jgi:hypothetical protein
LAAEGFEVDLPRLSGAAPKLSEAGDALTGALAELRGVLDECAAMFGDDDHGREFADGYRKAAHTVDKAAEHASHGVLRLAATVERMVDSCHNLEDTNARMCRMTGRG